MIEFYNPKTGHDLAIPIPTGPYDEAFIEQEILVALGLDDRGIHRKEKIMTLKEKLHAIYGTIDKIEKHGHNKFQNYDYIRAADVTNAIRKALMDQRVYAEINFVFDGPVYNIVREKSPSAPFSAVNVRCSIVFHDLDSTETLTSSGLGTGADTGDKAAYKAMTGALKYALKNGFLVPDEADPEADERMDEGTRSADEMPDFQSTQRGHVQSTSAPRPAAAPKAQPASRPAPAAQSAAKASAPAPATPSAGPSPTEVQLKLNDTPAVAEREPGDEPTASSDDAVPNEAELQPFRMLFQKLGDDLSTLGKLKSSKGLPINRKLLVWLLAVVGAADAKEVTIGQWKKFFSRVDATKAQFGEEAFVKLTGLVNTANGIEVAAKK